MKINLYAYSDYFYFAISTKNNSAYTSQNIASLLNLDIDTYNKLLIDKVINHSKYSIAKNRDLTFSKNNTSKEVYIERFKNTFADQLTLLVLE